jgi:hypothetical protein
MKILGPNDTGKGILIEYDAGYINPKSMPYYKNTTHPIGMVESIRKKF